MVHNTAYAKDPSAQDGPRSRPREGAGVAGRLEVQQVANLVEVRPDDPSAVRQGTPGRYARVRRMQRTTDNGPLTLRIRSAGLSGCLELDVSSQRSVRWRMELGLSCIRGGFEPRMQCMSFASQAKRLQLGLTPWTVDFPAPCAHPQDLRASLNCQLRTAYSQGTTSMTSQAQIGACNGFSRAVETFRKYQKGKKTSAFRPLSVVSGPLQMRNADCPLSVVSGPLSLGDAPRSREDASWQGGGYRERWIRRVRISRIELFDGFTVDSPMR
jgi:hypothetical protein